MVISHDGKWAWSGRWIDLADGKEKTGPVVIPEEANLNRCFSDGSYLVYSHPHYQIVAPGADKPRERLPFDLSDVVLDGAGRFCLRIRGDAKESHEVALIDLRQDNLEKSRRILASSKNVARWSGLISTNGTHASWVEVPPSGVGQLQVCVYDIAAS